MSTYTINDIATMTGLSTRTVREYMKLGFLSGEKENGVWRFTDEAMGALFANGAVAPSIKAKRNALVYDFMLDEKKKSDELCAVLDLMAEGKDAMDISGFFCSAINSGEFSGLAFGFEHSGKNARVIVKGPAEEVLGIMNAYYNG